MVVRKCGYAHLTPSPRYRSALLMRARLMAGTWFLVASAGPPYPNGPKLESSRVAPGLLNGAGLERSRDFADGPHSPVREAEGTTVGVILGFAMLGIAAALLLLGRPRKGEDMRPFLTSSLVYAVYPAMILVFIAMEMLTIVMNL
jgi:hypothetical protein